MCIPFIAKVADPATLIRSELEKLIRETKSAIHKGNLIIS